MAGTVTPVSQPAGPVPAASLRPRGRSQHPRHHRNSAGTTELWSQATSKQPHGGQWQGPAQDVPATQALPALPHGFLSPRNQLLCSPGPASPRQTDRQTGARHPLSLEECRSPIQTRGRASGAQMNCHNSDTSRWGLATTEVWDLMQPETPASQPAACSPRQRPALGGS